jgi:hypothetical protein
MPGKAAVGAAGRGWIFPDEKERFNAWMTSCEGRLGLNYVVIDDEICPIIERNYTPMALIF